MHFASLAAYSFDGCQPDALLLGTALLFSRLLCTWRLGALNFYGAEAHRWITEQMHDYILLLANTRLRSDQAKNLWHRAT